jgi:hypothetical protein
MKVGKFEIFVSLLFFFSPSSPLEAQGNVWMFLSFGYTNLLTLIPILVLFCIMWFFNSGKQLHSRKQLVVFSKKLSGLAEAMRIRRYINLKGH